MIASLSILICHLPDERAEEFASLKAEIYRQSEYASAQCGLTFQCIIDDRPRGVVTTGEKRNRLLQRALGAYVAFIDDDDLIATDYLPRIVVALKDNPD